MNLTDRIVKALALFVVVALGVRLVADLLGPVLPALLMLGALVLVLTFIVKGPHTKR